MTERYQPRTMPTMAWHDLLDKGRYADAARAYRASDGTDALVLANLDALAEVQSALRAKSWHGADRALERVEERHQTLPWDAIERDLAALRSAGSALDAREPTKAREALAAAAGSAFAAEAATLSGTLAIYEGETDAARGHFELALELDPDHYRALTNLGNLDLEAGDVDGAIAAYERAIKLNDSFANAHHNLGVAYRRKGMISQSVRSLRRAQREGSRRDTEEARTRLRGRSRSGAPSSSARTLRWVLIALGVAAAFWFLGGRSF
jgi:tetratricopeptide (TPR) repeat protein